MDTEYGQQIAARYGELDAELAQEASGDPRILQIRFSEAMRTRDAAAATSLIEIAKENNADRAGHDGRGHASGRAARGAFLAQP